MPARKKTIGTTLLMLSLLLLVWLLARPDNPSVDSDLKPARALLKNEDNGFPLLQDALPEIYLPDALRMKLSRLDIRTNWNAELAADLLRSNAVGLAALNTALEHSGFQLPPMVSPGATNESLGSFKQLALLKGLQVKSLFLAGRETEAFAEAMVIVRYGHRFENADGFLIHYLVGASIKGMGLQQIRQMTAITSLPSASLEPLISELDAHRANVDGLSNALKAEYQLLKQQIDDMASGTATGPSTWQNRASRLGMKPVFRPEQTKAMEADRIRNCLRAIPEPAKKMPLPDETTNQPKPSIASLLISGNAVGRMMVEMDLSGAERATRRKYHENCDVAATRLLLALRGYHNEHGELPGSLADLVPKYLAQIPVDDFDGEPFRYSREKKILYAVGEDLKDDGGQDSNLNQDRLDLVYPIEF